MYFIYIVVCRVTSESYWLPLFVLCVMLFRFVIIVRVLWEVNTTLWISHHLDMKSLLCCFSWQHCHVSQERHTIRIVLHHYIQQKANTSVHVESSSTIVRPLGNEFDILFHDCNVSKTCTLNDPSWIDGGVSCHLGEWLRVYTRINKNTY